MAASSSNSQVGSVAAARQELRKLTDHVVNNKAEATSTRSDFLGKALDKGNRLYEQVKHDARGAALDANFLAKTSALGADQAGNLEKVTPEKYIAKLRAKYGFQGRGAIKWPELAAAVEAAQIFNLTPAVTFLDGRFEPAEKKKRAAREKKQTEPEGPIQHANNVSVDALKEQEEDKAQVVRMAKLAKVIKEKSAESASSGGPKHVCLFRTLLHPTSFSQTVENFFDLAFLIKAGDAGLDKEEDGLYIKRMKKPDADDFKTGKAVRTQNILKLDYPTYKKLVARWLPPGTAPFLSSRDGDEAVEDEEDAAAAARPKKKGRAA